MSDAGDALPAPVSEPRGNVAGGALAQPVSSLMSDGLIASVASESLAVAAARMSAHRVHALLVEPEQEGGPFAVLSDVDLLAALGAGEDPDETEVGCIAATDPLTIPAAASATEAAKAMTDHGVNHVFVVERADSAPVGVVSSIDLAHALMRGASGRADAPRIVVAHDAGPGGDDAVALARLLAAGDASVLAAIAVPFPPGVIGDPPLQPPERVDSWEQLCRALRKQGSRVLSERAHKPLAGLQVSERVIVDDSAARAITTLCEMERPDLLAIGSTHRGPFGRVLLGSTGERLVHGSSVPVAIAPQGFADPPRAGLARIAVGFDGRPESVRALRLASGLANRHGATLELIAVLERQIGEFEVIAEAFDALSGEELHDHRAERLRRQAEEALAKHGITGAGIRVTHGSPVDQLLSACKEDVDLLVLGSRGYGPLARVMLGSVSARVSRRAACPVLLAERAA